MIIKISDCSSVIIRFAAKFEFMKSLKEIYQEHTGRLLNKWEHYFDVYEQYFSKYRDKKITLLEFGIAHGGSLELWRKYFGEAALIIGVDVNPECKKFEMPNTPVFIGSQEDKNFLSKLKSQVPEIDILIDDGGHTMRQQILTFEYMFEKVKQGGLYLCEDTHTSYMKDYFGGYKKKNTFIEYSKNFIDAIHGWHFEKDKKPFANQITKNVRGVHFYDSMVILEKEAMLPPKNTFKGEPTLTQHFMDFGQKKSVVQKIKGVIKPKK